MMKARQIFSLVLSHMIQGIMVHDQLANYFDFLNLQWYRKKQEYQFIDESYEYRKLCSYYINHFNEIIPEPTFNNVRIIPQIWYDHSRYDLDQANKKEAVKNGFETWVKWERDTKSTYEQAYIDLLSLGDIACSNIINKLIKNVDEELKQAENELINLISVDFQMDVVIPEQKQENLKIKITI